MFSKFVGSSALVALGGSGIWLFCNATHLMRLVKIRFRFRRIHGAEKVVTLIVVVLLDLKGRKLPVRCGISIDDCWLSLNK